MSTARSPQQPAPRLERTSEIVPLESEKPLYLSVAGATDIGRVREKNEDAFVVADLTGGTLLDGESHQRFDVGERGVLLAVSDGMGGAHAGEVASALVVETLTRALRHAPADKPRDALMDDAIQRAHRAVRDEAKREGKKMGATLTAVFVHDGEAYIAEVGDSRAYLIRNGKIRQLTHDQSLVQMLLDGGVITQEDAEHSPIRNVILQAMGNQPDVKIALAKLSLRNRDCLVLCSDGLTGLATDEEIRDVILESGRPEIATQQLIDFANERGGKDNITVVVAGVGGSLPGPADSFGDTFEVLKAFDGPPVSRRPKKG
ncbi:MAG: serine/threonine-protein phosphatase [Deltaproteobacteria bacterium]|nr:serine/threonine-protein phosphatase [Deltaproteobacteria bacterium]